MAKHRKGKRCPFFHRSRRTDNQKKLMSLLFTAAQLAGRSFAELTQGIVTCVCIRRGLRDASGHMAKLLREEGLDRIDASQRDIVTIAMR